MAREVSGPGRLLIVGLTLGLLAVSPYLIPGLDRMRPWVTGESVPLVRLFNRGDSEPLPAFGEAGGAYTPSTSTNTAHSSERILPGSPTGESPDGHAPGVSPVQLDPKDYSGIEVPIEDPSGQALRTFYEALYRTAAGKSGAITRIAHYGDSSIATDLITHTVRRHLQQRFGDAGHGFVLISSGSMPYGHRDVRHRASDAWDLRPLVYKQDREGYYGYGGVQFRGSPGAYASFGTDEDAPVGTHVSRFLLYYQQRPNSGNIAVRVDEGSWESFSTEGESIGSGLKRFEVSDGSHTFSVRFAGGGPVRLYGVALERDGPGVIYDSLGMVGARARRLLNYDPDHIREQIALRPPDLLILGFGGNEANDPIVQAERYDEELREVIQRMRAGRPTMSCLVFAPLDQAERTSRGHVVTMPSLPIIIQAQRQAAQAEGCAFYDTFEAMGGEGTMTRWYRARPRLALGDFRHATPLGYEVVGTTFYRALLQGFAAYIRAKDGSKPK